MKISTFAYDPNDPNNPLAYAERTINVNEKTGDVTGDTLFFRLFLQLCNGVYKAPCSWKLPIGEVGKFISMCTRPRC